MEKTFEEMMAEVKEGEPTGGRKLTFREKCGAFAALYDGAKNNIVARAFGLSIQTVSKLSGCLDVDPEPYRLEYETGYNKYTGQPHNPDVEHPVKVFHDHNRNRRPMRILHYQDVAREFQSMSPAEFNRLYYTPRIHDRIMAAKRELRGEKAKMRTYRFAGPRAEWKMLDEWSSGSQLKYYGVKPEWLDMTFPHRGGTWRVEGLNKNYRCKQLRELVIVSTDGATATIAITVLKKIIEPA